MPPRAALFRILTLTLRQCWGRVFPHNAGVAGSSPAPAIWQVDVPEDLRRDGSPLWRAVVFRVLLRVLKSLTSALPTAMAAGPQVVRTPDVKR